MISFATDKKSLSAAEYLALKNEFNFEIWIDGFTPQFRNPVDARRFLFEGENFLKIFKIGVDSGRKSALNNGIETNLSAPAFDILT